VQVCKVVTVSAASRGLFHGRMPHASRKPLSVATNTPAAGGIQGFHLMRTIQLLQRNLSYYWLTHLAVVLGVAIAVAVLTGALMIGESVRTSLRELLLSRLGNTDLVISTGGYSREQLAQDLESDNEFSTPFQAACPLIVLEGIVTHQQNGRRALGVQVYGVDERFWVFHGESLYQQFAGDRSIWLSPSLGQELGVKPGDSILLRVQKPSVIPAEFLHGRRDDQGHTLRFSAGSAPTALREFSVRPQQTEVRAVFVSLRRLQKELQLNGKINTILVSERKRDGNWQQSKSRLEAVVRRSFRLDDLGITVRILGRQGCLALESESALINQNLAQAAQAAADVLNLQTSSILTYLANVIRYDRHEVPYSLVTAVDRRSLSRLSAKRSAVATQNRTGASEQKELPGSLPPILLNDWTARDLGVQPGAEVSLDYYIWLSEGELVTRTAQFRLQDVLPLQGPAADSDLAPEYPGITESDSLSDWDPPFPMDLGRIRPKDEAYWRQYKTTPKAFIPLQTGQALWQSRFGRLSSVRFFPAQGSTPETALDSYRQRLRSELDPFQMGFVAYAARAQGLEASRGATDFGDYFLYFSGFLVSSALLLTALFFRLGVEQRLREIGLLQALGFPSARIRTLFFSEGLALATLGSITGIAGAVAYGKFIMWGLGHWWAGAVGTTRLALHLSPGSMFFGIAAGILSALVCIAWTLKSLASRSPRSLLSGAPHPGNGESGKRRRGESAQPARHQLAPPLRLSDSPFPRFRPSILALTTSLLGLLLLTAASLNRLDQVGGFFGAGTLLLIAALFQQRLWLRRGWQGLLHQKGWWGISRLGIRNVADRPGRSMLCIALIASATFIIVAVEAFRRSGFEDPLNRKSGTGGYTLMAESLVPVHHNFNTESGRESLNFDSQRDAILEQVAFSRFRVRPGDDASCLNLYEPKNPKILAATQEFIRSNRFAFQSALATNADEKANPWLLLNKTAADGAVPVIADANSMTYILHRNIGDSLELNTGSVHPIHLQLVAALSDSLFQSEVLMSEENFLRLFPNQQGYRFFLLDTSLHNAESVPGILEDRLSDFGFDVTATTERLAAFHRVENTYLSTFQSLGTLGLILGTMGLATVLLRNVLERRRELALLQALGYTPMHLTVMIVAESLFLIVSGLAIGTLCAVLAIVPTFLRRGNGPPFASMAVLLVAVSITGTIASIVATAVALRSPLLPALRRE